MRFILVKIFLVCCCLVNLSLSAVLQEGEVVLDVPGYGKIKGRQEKSIDNRDYVTYSDIVYARIAENGWFKCAIPATSEYEGVVNENSFPVCPKWDYFSQHTNLGDGNEDGAGIQDFDDTWFRNCLVLKIDTKDVTARNPVIVYLSGYDVSSGHINEAYGTYLMKKDVVLVTVQYRGEAFGYLSTLTDEIPGNMAILDVILALRWIQRYISYFGGDPRRVTLNGQHLAAGIIGALTASPLGEGLFHQVIYQSGSFDLDELKTSNPIEIAAEVARELGCTNIIRVTQLNHCLLRSTRKAVLRAYDTVAKRNGGVMYPITVGGPSGIIEDYYPRRKYPSIGGFVDQPAIHLLEKNRPKTNYSRFSKMFLEDNYADELQRLTQILNTRIGGPSKLLAEFYGKDALNNKVNVKDGLLDALIQAFLPVEIDMRGLDIKLSVLKTLLKNRELGGNSYLYIYKIRDMENSILSGKAGRTNVLKNYVTLGDDLLPVYTDRSYPGSQMSLVNFMVDLWSSFAATGKPSSVINWPELTSLIGPYLVIDTMIRSELNLLNELTPTINCHKTPGCQWAEL